LRGGAQDVFVIALGVTARTTTAGLGSGRGHLLSVTHPSQLRI
jgi:hypothetical protein